MRPISGGPEDTRTFQLIIIGLIIVGVVIGILWIQYSPNSEEKTKSFFLKQNLEKDEIAAGEDTLLEIKVINPTDRTYSDLEIQLASPYPKIKFHYTEEYEIKKVDGEYRLTVPLGRPLRTKGKTTTYTFDIGGGLYPGTTSTTVDITARVISEENTLGEKSFKLTIEKENE